MPPSKPSTSLYARRKTFAIKHDEAEPLTRRDIQYDLLAHIFGDSNRVFTDPNAPDTRKATFRDLYVHAIIQSSRCSRALREKMQDNPDFATDFAKISLLANVGRINTTMTFLPEMRTALRTYHPVPSLQKTDGNLQDAPRIKNILKACTLKTETQGVAVSPAELRARAVKGIVPTTSIVNLLFVLSNHFAHVAHEHFGRLDIDFLDLFLPSNISSQSRANAFLWLMYHYHEGTSENPFDDAHARSHNGMIPKLVEISDKEMALENVDPPEEKQWGAKMSQFRMDFLSKNKQNPKPGDASHDKGKKGGGVGKGKGKGTASTAGKAPEKTLKRQHSDTETGTPPADADVQEEREYQRRRLSYTQDVHEGAPQPSLVLPPPVLLSPDFPPRYRIPLDGSTDIGPQRSIMQQALHVVNMTDPSADSDDEGTDEQSRYDYAMRLHVLANISAKHRSSVFARLPKSLIPCPGLTPSSLCSTAPLLLHCTTALTSICMDLVSHFSIT